MLPDSLCSWLGSLSWFVTPLHLLYDVFIFLMFPALFPSLFPQSRVAPKDLVSFCTKREATEHRLLRFTSPSQAEEFPCSFIEQCLFKNRRCILSIITLTSSNFQASIVFTPLQLLFLGVLHFSKFYFLPSWHFFLLSSLSLVLLLKTRQSKNTQKSLHVALS